MDPYLITSLIAGAVNMWLPVLLGTFKSAAGKASLKKCPPILRTIAANINQAADSIEALPMMKRARR